MKNVTMNKIFQCAFDPDLVICCYTVRSWRDLRNKGDVFDPSLCLSGCYGGLPALQTEIRFRWVRLLRVGPTGRGGSEEEGVFLQKVPTHFTFSHLVFFFLCFIFLLSFYSRRCIDLFTSSWPFLTSDWWKKLYEALGAVANKK